MLPLALMERVLAAADALVPLAGAEVSVEANPGTLLGAGTGAPGAGTGALPYLRGLRGLGVNRLSMGVQSLHDPTLRMLGRIHTAAEARQSFEDARRAGFDNINLDFIFGLPGQTEGQWRDTLEQIATWGAEHFSLYSLILEPSTPLYAQVTSGRITVPDDDASAAMYEQAIERLAAAGYVQYEISNWAKAANAELRIENAVPFSILNSQFSIPQRACHHNLAYWLNADYLAAGAGAHGHLYPRRYANILGIDAYIAAAGAGELPVAEVTALSADDLRAETMFMGLRLNAGVSLAHFRERCGIELDAAYGDTLAELASLGLLERDVHAVRLTTRGRMLGNQVFAHFV
jgi:oxygen-independent coproporphyrinogen-3 oxidase